MTTPSATEELLREFEEAVRGTVKYGYGYDPSIKENEQEVARLRQAILARSAREDREGKPAAMTPEWYEKEIASRQAQIDRLMLEFCTDEMTPEQIENWKRHQIAAGPEVAAALDRAAASLGDKPREAYQPCFDLWDAVRLMAEGSDWKRDQGETLTAWAQRTLRARSATGTSEREQKLVAFVLGIADGFSNGSEVMSSLTPEASKMMKAESDRIYKFVAALSPTVATPSTTKEKS